MESSGLEQKKITNVRNMRLVYSIAMISLVLASVSVALFLIVVLQIIPENSPTNGLSVLGNSYQSSEDPISTSGMLLSNNKSKLMLFTDNLYVLDLNQLEKNPILWSATDLSVFPYNNSFLSLSTNGTLSVNQVDPKTGEKILLWSNGIFKETSGYYLQLSDSGKLQVISSGFQTVWTN